MSLIKVAYFMLNFLNLKSFSIHLFFWVASSLSTLCRADRTGLGRGACALTDFGNTRNKTLSFKRPSISYGSSDLQAFHRHWTYFAILGWVQFNDHILETGLFKRMRALEKPQEKRYRPPRA